MMHKKTYACLITLTLVLMSCAPQNEHTNLPVPPTITFAAPEADDIIYQPIIKAFNQQNPDMHVQFVPLASSDTSGTGREQIKHTTDKADTLVTDSIDDVAQSGLAYDLAPLMHADASFHEDDFYPHTLDPFTDGDQQFIIPYEFQPPMLHYNKDLWASQGLPPPNPNWQWNDFINAFSSLAIKNGTTIERYGFLQSDGSEIPLVAELTQRGFNPLGDGGQPDFTAPAVHEAIEQVKQYADDGTILFTGNDLNQLILDRKLVAWPPNAYVQLDDSIHIGVMRFPPIPRVPSPYTINIRGYMMSRGTTNPIAAWRWLSFLSKQPLHMDHLGNAEQFPVPVRRSIAEQLHFWDSMPEETRAALESAMETPSQMLPMGDYDIDTVSALSFIVDGVTFEHKPIDQVLESVQASLTQKLASRKPVPTEAPPIVNTPLPENDPNIKNIQFGGVAFSTGPMARFAALFNQQHPGYLISFPPITTNPLNLHEMADQYDCFIGWTPPEQSQVQDLADLHHQATADGPQLLADYPTALLAPYQIDGGLYGLPYMISLRDLAYNPTLFDLNALPTPSSDWSIDDFLRYAQQMTSTHGKQKTYGFVGNSPDDVFFFLDRFKAEPVQFSGASLTLQFTDPQVEQALDYYLQLLKTASPHTTLYGYHNGEFAGAPTRSLIDAGQVGMWLDTTGNNSDTSIEAKHIAPLFGGGHAGRHDVLSLGMYISRTSSAPEMCWEWIKFLNQQPPAFSVGFPARRGIPLSDSLAGDRQENETLLKAYQAALDRTSGQPVIDNDPITGGTVNYYWFFQAVDHALQGENLHTELEQAEATTKAYVACIQQGGNLETCPTQVDPTYKGG